MNFKSGDKIKVVKPQGSATRFLGQEFYVVEVDSRDTGKIKPIIVLHCNEKSQEGKKYKQTTVWFYGEEVQLI